MASASIHRVWSQPAIRASRTCGLARQRSGRRWRSRAPWAEALVSSSQCPAEQIPETMADAEPARPLRLLVVDDHEIVRQGLVALLDRRPGFEVVAQAGSVAESIDQARLHEPDIVVMDVRLPDGSGV